ncbi:histidine--tRNA ligase [Salinispira pacifica]|uniref:Histidine--tRNA ligase n=1 Tax=Salinispira pacifica TaxID=1307761 RepID=V5WEJ2_9SPIO|nr:histidine--tRNA ligase [Salinispira pacifica]AHC14232.1 Histidyl-tRNA synthetase [Salinispira pacifica]
MIQPRVLKGFRDILPDQEILRRNILRSIEDSCRSFGFVPIDTPVLEYSEVLLGKGSGETDKQIYRFQDHGKRDVSMRFDLTVPFARFMGAHVNELYLPFKRYHFGKVFRGENTQKGRYREFMQCDFDIVGVDSPAADFEILQLMYANFSDMGIRKVKFHINHRGIFNQFLGTLGVGSKSEDVLRSVDKLSKLGAEKTRENLTEITGAGPAAEILDFIHSEAGNAETLDKMERLAGGASEHSRRLREILQLADAIGMGDFFHINPSITRGLDYYTGIVYETFLDELPEIGSVCSGGRYNDLASLYTKTEIQGVGSSIGLDRLMAAMEELERNNSQESDDSTPSSLRFADVLIFMMDEKYLGNYTRMAQKLRASGLRTEIFPLNKKMGQQFSYAEKKRIPLGIIAGEAEISSDTVNYKNLLTRESIEGITLDRALEQARKDLNI